MKKKSQGSSSSSSTTTTTKISATSSPSTPSSVANDNRSSIHSSSSSRTRARTNSSYLRMNNNIINSIAIDNDKVDQEKASNGFNKAYMSYPPTPQREENDGDRSDDTELLWISDTINARLIKHFSNYIEFKFDSSTAASTTITNTSSNYSDQDHVFHELLSHGNDEGTATGSAIMDHDNQSSNQGRNEQAMSFSSSSSSSSSSTTNTNMLSTLSALTALKKYKSDRFLGQGQFSKVLLIHWNEMVDEQFAMKVIDLNSKDNRDQRMHKNEIRILSKLSSNYINYLHMAWKRDSKIYLLLGYCEKGTLNDLNLHCKSNSQWFSVHEILCFLHDGCSALAYVHSQLVIHNDVKPANILIRNNQLLLGDFGRAIEMRYAEEYVRIDEDGDSFYMSAEAIDAKKSTKSDMFSFGLTMLQLMTTIDIINDDELRGNIRAYGANNYWNDFNVYPQHVFQIIFNLLEHEPSQRKDAKDLLENEQIIQNPSREDFIQRLANYSPNLDLGLNQSRRTASPSFPFDISGPSPNTTFPLLSQSTTTPSHIVDTRVNVNHTPLSSSTTPYSSISYSPAASALVRSSMTQPSAARALVGMFESNDDETNGNDMENNNTNIQMNTANSNTRHHSTGKSSQRCLNMRRSSKDSE